MDCSPAHLLAFCPIGKQHSWIDEFSVTVSRRCCVTSFHREVGVGQSTGAPVWYVHLVSKFDTGRQTNRQTDTCQSADEPQTWESSGYNGRLLVSTEIVVGPISQRGSTSSSLLLLPPFFIPPSLPTSFLLYLQLSPSFCPPCLPAFFPFYPLSSFLSPSLQLFFLLSSLPPLLPSVLTWC